MLIIQIAAGIALFAAVTYAVAAISDGIEQDMAWRKYHAACRAANSGRPLGS